MINVRLPVEHLMLEVVCLETDLMLFILFSVRIVETSMLVRLLILKLDLESIKVTSILRKIVAALADITI